MLAETVDQMTCSSTTQRLGGWKWGAYPVRVSVVDLWLLGTSVDYFEMSYLWLFRRNVINGELHN